MKYIENSHRHLLPWVTVWNAKGRFIHPEQDRDFTPRELAALQGFPDNFIFYGKCLQVQIVLLMSSVFIQFVPLNHQGYLVEC
ncbi:MULTISPECIES: DNA cytosine methyltransferase [unclassified Anabaena]|uniref:DNA cytosine methyltransferase n=1 Tax=unclassified Anabaena TaxID=2619674 RepID=UPI00082EB693|nr:MULTISPECIES: DNA cytosine methyltransferase [unclassified Anabaena]